jgi:outer membrane protein assembly factor BamE (lipoprotein component of BamABCDE complex)
VRSSGNCPCSDAVVRPGGRAAAAALLACLAALAGGCTIGREFVGSPLPVEALAHLRPGLSKPEVLDLLGPPDAAGLRLDGSVFIYRFQNEEGLGVDVSVFRASFSYDRTDRLTDRIVVFFDKKGLVKAFAKTD